MFYGILAALAAVIVGLDQWTKWLTVTHIPSTNGSAVVKAIPGFFHITHIKNTGAAWSMLEGQTWLFVLVTAAFFAIVGVLIWKKVLQKKFELVCLAMIAGGALGNLIDRVVSGAVTDGAFCAGSAAPCRGGACPSRRKTANTDRLALKRQAPIASVAAVSDRHAGWQ